MTAIDNDILHKGAGFGLLKQIIGAIPADISEVGYLGAVKFIVGKKLRKANLNDAFALLNEVLQQAQCLEPTKEEAEFAAQIEYEAQRASLSVDSGESLLCAIVIMRAFSWLVTGDKRAIQGLEELLSRKGDIQDIAGKVICLEQLLLRLIQKGDPLAIRSAICAQRSLDRSLAICFSCSSPEVGLTSWVEALESYLRELRAASPSILSSSSPVP